MITFPVDTQKIVLCGDWHANYSYSRRALNYAFDQGAQVVIQLGDFGAWSLNGYFTQLEKICKKYDRLLMFIDGNHEDHIWLNSLPVDQDGVRRITEHVWHLPRGFRWEWQNVSFTALGGAHSVDMKLRTLGVDWFTEETINFMQAQAVTAQGHTDVLLTHDCPQGVKIKDQDDIKAIKIYGEDQIIQANAHRDLLRSIVEEITPYFIWHGHYHVKYTDTITLNNAQQCYVTGMGRDKDFFKNNMDVIDISALKETIDKTKV